MQLSTDDKMKYPVWMTPAETPVAQGLDTRGLLRERMTVKAVVFFLE